MPSKKRQFHLYLDEELYNALVAYAPSYGAAAKLVQALIAKHLEEAAQRGKATTTVQ